MKFFESVHENWVPLTLENSKESDISVGIGLEVLVFGGISAF